MNHGHSFLGAIAVMLFLALPFSVVWAGDSNGSQGSSQQSAAGVVCEIKPYHDKPTMFVNGRPRFPMAYMSYYPEPFRYQQMAEHGIHVYSVALTLTDKWLGGDKPVKWNTPGIWRGPEDLDLSVVETSLRQIVDKDPEALIFPRIFCDSPAWWDMLHPEETNGQGKLGGQERRQSFSSVAWRNDTADALKKIVQFVSSSKYGDHVIGYMITAGQTEEFFTLQPDRSPRAEKSFREWLLKRYGNDPRTIHRLFGKKIEALSIPSSAELRKGDCGNFLDPRTSRLVVDFCRFHSSEMVDSALTLCKAVKEASDGRLMTGIFYGYTRVRPHTGQVALRRVLESKDIDFVTTCLSTSLTETDSILKAGKLFYSENDDRTSLSQWISKIRPDIDPDGVYNEKRWLGPPTISASLHKLKAVFAKNLVCGWACWWFDLWGGWYDDEAFLRLFSRMQAVGDESIHLPRRSAAQIAMFLDEEAYCYLPYGVGGWGTPFQWIEGQLQQMRRIGAPYDFYLLDDVKDLDLSRYRMLVFLNAFALSEEQRRTIRERCMADNRLLVWMYAPGLIREDLSADNVSSLLGMKIQMDQARPASRIRMDMPGGELFYQGAAVSPFLHVVEGADTVHGRTPDDQIVVAEKQMPDYRNLFVAMPPIPWKILQHHAGQAGVHIYSEAGDTVYASESYLAIVPASEGKRTIRLPQKVALKELLAIGKDETVVGKGQTYEANTRFEIDFPARACRLFQVVH